MRIQEAIQYLREQEEIFQPADPDEVKKRKVAARAASREQGRKDISPDFDKVKLFYVMRDQTDTWAEPAGEFWYDDGDGVYRDDAGYEVDTDEMALEYYEDNFSTMVGVEVVEEGELRRLRDSLNDVLGEGVNEAEDIFLPAPKEELKVRKAAELERAKKEAAKERELHAKRKAEGWYVARNIVTSSSGRMMCKFCKTSIPKDEMFLSMKVSGRYGPQNFNICKGCLVAAAREVS